LSSRFPSKTIRIKIHRTVILSVLLHGCETWVSHMKGTTWIEDVSKQGAGENI
jgi:hypothetical protein